MRRTEEAYRFCGLALIVLAACLALNILDAGARLRWGNCRSVEGCLRLFDASVRLGDISRAASLFDGAPAGAGHSSPEERTRRLAAWRRRYLLQGYHLPRIHCISGTLARDDADADLVGCFDRTPAHLVRYDDTWSLVSAGPVR